MSISKTKSSKYFALIDGQEYLLCVDESGQLDNLKQSITEESSEYIKAQLTKELPLTTTVCDCLIPSYKVRDAIIIELPLTLTGRKHR